jgi:hypothetical protein
VVEVDVSTPNLDSKLTEENIGLDASIYVSNVLDLRVFPSFRVEDVVVVCFVVDVYGSVFFDCLADPYRVFWRSNPIEICVDNQLPGEGVEKAPPGNVFVALHTSASRSQP